MTSGSFRVFVCLAALASCVTVSAADGDRRNRYKWRDAGGALHYSDSLPAEAAKFGYEVVNGQGIVVRRVERAKTADELAVAKAQQARQTAEREEAQVRARQDAKLLSAYPDTAALDRAHRQRLEMLEQQVEAARIGLRSQEQALADQLAHAAEIERNGKTLPAPQVQLIAQTRKEVEHLDTELKRREQERASAATALDAEKTRYLQLQADPAQRGKTP